MTPAMATGLRAVGDGLVFRYFRGDGNVFQGPGSISHSTYYRLERAGLIRENPGSSKGSMRVKMIPTQKGQHYLDTGEEL